MEAVEPPTKDKVIQVNMITIENLKPIFINESLTPPEKEELVALTREMMSSPEIMKIW